MTGSGTQSDPYICSNWYELQSVTGSDSYIKMADLPQAQKVIDFSEIQPNGFPEAVDLRGFIDFNGWTFKNFYSASNTTAIKIGGWWSILSTIEGGSSWSNLVMKNFFHVANIPSGGYAVPHFIAYERGEPPLGIEITNCKFYGELNYNNAYLYPTPASFISKNTNPAETDCIKISNSAFNIKVKCNTAFEAFGFKEMEKCRVKADISAPAITLTTCEYGVDSLPLRVNNCHFSGFLNDTSDSPHNVTVGGDFSSFNVYDIESNAPLEYKGGGISVFNSEKATPSAYNDIFVGLTTAQLQNDTALLSVGFPCEVVQNGNN